MKKIIKLEIILSLITFVLLLIIAFNTNITGDSGDSITHYLYSHYAFKYPHFFLHHWAKPFFVFCSATFSQFGFKGIIVFNCICATLSALFSFYIAKNLKIKHSWLVFIFIFFAPLYFKLIFSGLTEYLFGLFLVIGIHLIIKSKYIYAAIIISFLPLIRSEGLLIVGVFGLYYLFQKKYKDIPYLLFGQLIYTAVGAFYYKDILWVVNKIPYANMGSPYGSGELLDFVHRLNYVIEKPIYLLLVIGSISLVYSLFRYGLKENNDVKVILILGSFISLFIAHSIFWWLGILNSMGLPRVLNAVVPLIAIISLIGVQFITSRVQNPIIKYSLLCGISLLICFYPFSNRPQGVVFDNQLFVIEENLLITEKVVPYIEKQFPDYSTSTVYFSHPYLSLALNIDYFDIDKHREMQTLLIDNVEPGAIIIWDDWFSVIQGRVDLEQLTNDSRFELMQTFQQKEDNRMIQYTVFKTIATTE
tara:strand:- start:1850 stop:3274 length:1425 start_codon:yes stop_codon:yes gene_type:complete